MKKCDGLNCYRRTPDKITYCCAECEDVHVGNPAGAPAPDGYPHSAICDAREIAARSGVMIPTRPQVQGGSFPPPVERE